MKKSIGLLLMTLAALPFASYAQDYQKLEVGPTAGILMQSGKGTYGVKLNYRDSNGLSIPISVDFTEDSRKISVGGGYNMDLNEKVALSVGAAIGNLQLEEQDFTDHKRLSVTTGLLQSEINFELSKRISIGAQVDLDLLNGVRASHFNDDKYYPEALNDSFQFIEAGKDSSGNPYWQNGFTGAQVYPEYGSKQEFDAAYDLNKSMKSMSSFSIGIKINLFK